MPSDEPWYTYVNGIPLTITKPNDPAQVLLQNPNIFSIKKDGVLDKDDCYICLDPEFAAMGMPLCYPCTRCAEDDTVPHLGHVPADDTVCTECGTDAQELYYQALEAECAEKGHDWKTSAPYRANGLQVIDGKLNVIPGKIIPAQTTCYRCKTPKEDHEIH